MAAIKFPYLMHCPKCRAKLKIKNKSMIGQRITCPKCKKRIEVVTPDEDAYVPYGVTELEPEVEEDDEPTEEELIEREEAELKVKRERRKKIIQEVVSTLVLIGILGGISWTVYKKIWVEGYGSQEKEIKLDKFGQPLINQ